MKKHVLFLTLGFALFACSDNAAQKSINDIKALEANPSLQASDTLINCYTRFSEKYPDHKLSPVFLFKAAQGLMQSNRTLKGTRMYESMGMKYEKDSLAPEALIRAGIGFQAANDPANAIRVYEVFLKRYPSHPRAGEIKKNIEYAGLSEEEFMRKFNEEVLGKANSGISVNDSTL